MRWLPALLITGTPALAKSSSVFSATLLGRLERTKSQSRPGLHACTVSPATDSGIGVSSNQCVAWAYFLPAELSEAATAETSNHGWLASNWIKRCPTVPVAATMPALNFFFMDR